MINLECHCGHKFLDRVDFAEHNKTCVGPPTFPTESAPATVGKLMDDATLAPGDTEFPINFESTPVPAKVVNNSSGSKIVTSDMNTECIDFSKSASAPATVGKLMDDATLAPGETEFPIKIDSTLSFFRKKKKQSTPVPAKIVNNSSGSGIVKIDLTSDVITECYDSTPVPAKVVNNSSGSKIVKIDLTSDMNTECLDFSKSAPATVGKLMDDATLAPGDTEFPIKIDNTPVPVKIVNNPSGSKILKIDPTSDMIAECYDIVPTVPKPDVKES